jgi:hypothetical protein
MRLLAYLHHPERGTCIARYTHTFEVIDCCRDGRRIGTLCGNAIYALDGTVLGRLGLLGAAVLYRRHSRSF